jgi:hypothetical protein
VFLEKAQGEVMLDELSVNLGGPVPAELIEGLDHGKARQADAPVGGAVVAQAGLAFDELAEILEMSPLLVGGLLGEIAMVVKHKDQVQVPQILRDGV